MSEAFLALGFCALILLPSFLAVRWAARREESSSQDATVHTGDHEDSYNDDRFEERRSLDREWRSHEDIVTDPI